MTEGDGDFMLGFLMAEIAADPAAYKQRLTDLKRATDDAYLAQLAAAETLAKVEEERKKGSAELAAAEKQNAANERLAGELRERQRSVEQGEQGLRQKQAKFEADRAEQFRKISEREQACERREQASVKRIEAAETLHAKAEKLQMDADMAMNRLHAALTNRVIEPVV